MHPDLICFSHLRWDLVFQRPNHLMARAARDRRVFYVEEPIVGGDAPPSLAMQWRDGVTVLTPSLPDGLEDTTRDATLRGLLDAYLREHRVEQPVLWYYTPMPLAWTGHLAAAAVVYDCMDHLAGFRGAPAGLLEQEARLIARADLLLTGGARLHELKRQDHPDAHCFPSSVDADHFGAARDPLPEPADQVVLPRPRIGYAGVIDERIDMALIEALAVAEPRWSVVLVGPVVKIDPADIPAHPSIHVLGRKDYRELPTYLGGWDAAIMPFAHNEATAYISPTKTPEYLAAGLPVASTAIHDVVQPYGAAGLVEIGDGPEAFVAACRRALATDPEALRPRVDRFLASRSWDRTWAAIDALLIDTVRRRIPVVSARPDRSADRTLERPAAARLRGTIAMPVGPSAVSAGGLTSRGLED